MSRSSLSVLLFSLIVSSAIAQDDRIVGEVRMWGGSIATIPDGWLMCNGTAISRTEYPELFAAIGTIYGSGNGSTSFNVPEFRNRSPMGANQDDGGVPKTNVSGSLVQSGGDTTVVGVATHSHALRIGCNGANVNGGGGVSFAGCESTPQIYTDFAPGPSAFEMDPGTISPSDDAVSGNNLHPYLAITFIIAAEPSQGAVPTVSEWGLVVLTLLLLVAGTIAFSRRQAVASE